jgi:RNA polymerase sigma-70 factor (ECF subfamily)
LSDIDVAEPVDPRLGAADPDARCMARLAAGDPDALNELHERYGGMAYAIALRITGEPTAAEDVVQDAFLGAWRNADRFSASRGAARTWLLSIVHHRAIDAIRRRRGATTLPDPEESAPDALVLPDVWGEVARNLDRETVIRALASIPTPQREALELAYFGGLTQVEISERTAVPLGTVKSRMRLGLLGLRRALLPDSPERAGSEVAGDG